MTTTACHECLTTCDLHNVTHCPTCHKHEDECGFGDCQRTAEYRLTHETGADVRQFCEHCATAPYLAFARVGYTVKRIAAPSEIEIHGPAYFDNTTNPKYVITIDGEFLKHEDAYGHDQITTFPTLTGARRRAEEL